MAQTATTAHTDDTHTGLAGPMHASRAKTRKPRKVKRSERDRYKPELEYADTHRPRRRCECVNGPRPCPWISCPYHLAFDVKPRNGHVQENFPDFGVERLDDLPDTCSLDVADRGEHTLEEVGERLNLTRERVRQIEAGALSKLMSALLDQGFEPDDIAEALRTV